MSDAKDFFETMIIVNMMELIEKRILQKFESKVEYHISSSGIGLVGTSDDPFYCDSDNISVPSGSESIIGVMRAGHYSLQSLTLVQ